MHSLPSHPNNLPPTFRNWRFSNAIKRLAPDKPIILLTAFPPEHQPEGIDLVLTKPFYFDTLREALAAMRKWQPGELVEPLNR